MSIGVLGNLSRPAIWRILITAVLCALGGWFLGWGPLNAGLAGQVALTATAGLLSAGLCGLEQIALVQGKSHTAKLYQRGLSYVIRVLLLAIGLLTFVQLYQTGLIFPLSEDRVAAFERLWRAMDDIYPYFELKRVDWVAIHARYLPLIEAAQNDEQYFSMIEAMLIELSDSHTYLVSPSFGPPGYFALTQEIDGQAVVKGETGIAREAGLEVGSILLAVDGRSVEETLLSVKPRLRNCSTPWCRRRKAFMYLLSVPSDGALVVEFETSRGELRTTVLAWPGTPLSEHLQALSIPVLPPTPATVQPPASQSSPVRTSYRHRDVWRLPPPLIYGEKLPSGVGLIHIPTFEEKEGHDLVAEFDAGLDELLDAPGLILDLRGNSGGSNAIGDRVAGRFLSRPFTYGRESHRLRIPQRGWLSAFECRVWPRLPVYTGPVVVLVDSGVASAAEYFLVALIDSGRVRTVGRRTGGAASSPLYFRLPGGGLVQFSAADFRRNDGTPIEGAGIVPDLMTFWTMDDVRQGRDPDLEAAERMILSDLEEVSSE